MEWQKLAFFVHCFVSTCLANQPTTVLELGLSVALFELNRTIWQDFFAFLWFILPRATFLVTSYILLSWNIENLLQTTISLQHVWHRALLHVSYLPIQVLKTQVLKTSLVLCVLHSMYTYRQAGKRRRRQQWVARSGQTGSALAVAAKASWWAVSS